MIEIIALVFITREIKKIALQKGLKPLTWKIYTIVCWFVFEIIGITLGILLFGMANIIPLAFFGLMCAFGGFLVIRSILINKPDKISDDDINRISVDDLRP
jgi:hypothetical protein